MNLLAEIFDMFRLKMTKSDYKKVKRKYLNKKLYPKDLERIKKLPKKRQEEIYQQCELWMDDKEKKEMYDYLEKYTHKYYFLSIPLVQTIIEVAVVLAIAIVPVTLYAQHKNNVAYNTLIDDQTLTIENCPAITLIGDNSMANGEVNDYINNMILKQPQFLLNNCQNIYILSKEKFDEYSSSEDLTENTYAYAKPTEKSVYVQLSTNNYDLESLTHELWHVYDFTHGDYYTDSSNLEDFQALYQSAPDSISEYGSTSSREFFADAGTMYIYHPDELKEKNIDVYNYFDNLEKS